MGYLTADSVPSGTVCRTVIIPDNQRFIANFLGAIEALTFSSNYSPFGALTPDEMAAACLPMFNSATFNVTGCKMIGEIVLFAGNYVPDPNWLVCDGSSLLISDYMDLYHQIGILYGSVDAYHFNIPDLRDRVVAGNGANGVGTQYGEATHTLSIGEIPNHAHTYASAAPNLTTVGPGVPEPTAVPAPGATSGVGGGGAHNNIQPTLAMNYLIVAK